MATISITISDDLLADVKRALDPVHRNVEDYLLSALYELTSNETGEPIDAEPKRR